MSKNCLSSLHQPPLQHAPPPAPCILDYHSLHLFPWQLLISIPPTPHRRTYCTSGIPYTPVTIYLLIKNQRTSNNQFNEEGNETGEDTGGGRGTFAPPWEWDRGKKWSQFDKSYVLFFNFKLFLFLLPHFFCTLKNLAPPWPKSCVRLCNEN